MFKRLSAWIAAVRERNEERERLWAAVRERTESGLTRFQCTCESALAAGLQNIGLALVDRTLGGKVGKYGMYIQARIADTDYTVWISEDLVEVSSETSILKVSTLVVFPMTSTLSRMEIPYDARTPEEFVTKFVSETISGLRKRKLGKLSEAGRA